MTGLSDHRWEGYSLEQKYTWLRQGQGPAAVRPGSEYLRSLAETYGESEAALRTELGQLVAHSVGEAADRTAKGLGGLVDRGREGGRSTVAGEASVERYGESFSALRAKMPGPAEVGRTSLAGIAPGGDEAITELAAVTGLQADYREGLTAYQHADKMANDAEFDACWELLGLGDLPLTLRLPSPGRTWAQRHQILTSVLVKLRRRGMAERSAPGERIAGPLRLLARPECQLDLRLDGDPRVGPLVGIGAAAGGSRLDAASWVRMCTGVRIFGQLGTAFRTERGTRFGPWVIGFHGTAAGHFLQLRRPSTIDVSVTVCPVDAVALARLSHELLAAGPARSPTH